jgi:DNA-binding transcriptional ArsR family regulator
MLLPAAEGGVELVAKFFRALGDPARLRLLEYLLDAEHTVTECTDRAGGEVADLAGPASYGHLVRARDRRGRPGLISAAARLTPAARACPAVSPTAAISGSPNTTRGLQAAYPAAQVAGVGERRGPGRGGGEGGPGQSGDLSGKNAAARADSRC